jgi:hypothetical protein
MKALSNRLRWMCSKGDSGDTPSIFPLVLSLIVFRLIQRRLSGSARPIEEVDMLP